MNDAIVNVPEPINEPIQSYAPKSAERMRLKTALPRLPLGPRSGS